METGAFFRANISEAPSHGTRQNLEFFITFKEFQGFAHWLQMANHETIYALHSYSVNMEFKR